MKKMYHGFGKHIWIIIIFFTILGIGLIAARLLFPVLNLEYAGLFIYIIAGLMLFYVMFKRHARNRTSQASNDVISEDTSPTWDSGSPENYSTRNKVRDTIKKRKVYHKKIRGNNCT